MAQHVPSQSYEYLHLHSFVYVRKFFKSSNDDIFHLLLLAHGQVYELEQIIFYNNNNSDVHSSIGDPVVKLRLPPMFKNWKEYFKIGASIASTELSSLYAFNLENIYDHYDIKSTKLLLPGYHLAIRTVTDNEYLLSQITKSPILPIRHGVYQKYSLIMDSLNRGYAINPDPVCELMNSLFNEYVIYGFNYKLYSDVAHSTFGSGEAKLHQLHPDSELQEYSYFFLHINPQNPTEVVFIPRPVHHHSKCGTNSSKNLSLLSFSRNTTVVGFIRVDHSIARMYLFDSLVGCVYVINVLPWPAMMNQYRKKEKFVQRMSVWTFEQILDCPNNYNLYNHGWGDRRGNDNNNNNNHCLARWTHTIRSTTTKPIKKKPLSPLFTNKVIKTTTSTITTKMKLPNHCQYEDCIQGESSPLSSSSSPSTPSTRYIPKTTAHHNPLDTKIKPVWLRWMVIFGIYSWFVITITGSICLCTFPLVMSISRSSCRKVWISHMSHSSSLTKSSIYDDVNDKNKNKNKNNFYY